MKQELPNLKAADKDSAADPQNKIYAITVDVQAVLFCPKLQASALYYKTRGKGHHRPHPKKVQ
jgi:hypothetical protein